MGSDNVKIEFDGFFPETEERSIIREVMRKIEYDSPSDSIIKLEIRKSWTGYIGNCRVTSAIGIFTAEKEAKSVEQLMAAVEKKIYENLNIWKSNRFKDETFSLKEMASAS